MRHHDLGARLIGSQRAAIIRIAALYPDGADPATIAVLSDLDPTEVETEAEQLVDLGILSWVDGAWLVANKDVLARTGVTGVLDTEARMLRMISRLAEDLTGDGARVAVYAGRQRDDGARLPMVIIEPAPPSPRGGRVSFLDELQLMLDTDGIWSLELLGEDIAPPFTTRTPLGEVRAWLAAEDLPVRLGVGVQLEKRERRIELRSQPRTDPRPLGGDESEEG